MQENEVNNILPALKKITDYPGLSEANAFSILIPSSTENTQFLVWAFSKISPSYGRKLLSFPPSELDPEFLKAAVLWGLLESTDRSSLEDELRKPQKQFKFWKRLLVLLNSTEEPIQAKGTCEVADSIQHDFNMAKEYFKEDLKLSKAQRNVFESLRTSSTIPSAQKQRPTFNIPDTASVGISKESSAEQEADTTEQPDVDNVIQCLEEAAAKMRTVPNSEGTPHLENTPQTQFFTKINGKIKSIGQLVNNIKILEQNLKILHNISRTTPYTQEEKRRLASLQELNLRLQTIKRDIKCQALMER